MNKATIVLIFILGSSLFMVLTPKAEASYVEFDSMGYHGMDDLFSSLVVTGTVILYDGHDQTGNSITFSNTYVPNLGSYQRGPYFWDTWNDIVKSIKVDGTVTFYEHADYNGRRITFTSGSLPYDYIGTEWNTNSRLIKSYDAWDCRCWHWDTAFLQTFHGDDNNYVNWVSDGLVNSRANDGLWDPWKASNFDQGYERYENQIPDLGDWTMYFDNIVSSLLVEGSVTLYDGIYYTGESETFTQDAPDLRTCGWDNRASSLKLTRGSRVTLYTWYNYQLPEYQWCTSFVYPSYQPSDLKVSNKNTITLEGVVHNWYTDTWTQPGWTGAKFDVFAVENRYSHTEKTLMLEMYFLRDGFNLVWNPCLFRSFDGNSYNLLIALDHEDYVNYVQRIVYPGDIAKWEINVKYFIEAACNHNWWPFSNLDITKLEIVKVSFTLEAAFGTFDSKVWCSLDRLRLAYTSSGGGGGGCPILYVFDGSEYVEQCLLDIHNPEGLDVLREQTLATEPEKVKNKYLLRLVEHPQTHSYIDQVQLFALLEDQTTIQLPLMSAVHSEYGNVLPKLLRSDDQKTETLGAEHNNGISQSIDLKFKAPKALERLNVIALIFMLEGNNYCYKR
jgi:hypothetical protein